ncbi:MAG: tetratricopeptide repeat protein [Anaerolineae bacterium]|nr:tetratricopeptide repeat protein [Anaerolineae bacterium]
MTDTNPSLQPQPSQPLDEAQFRRHMRQAAALLSQGKGKTALSLLAKCYELYPDDVNVLTNLGGAYILAGQHRHAIPHLEKASEIAPDNPAVWSNLAAAYLGKIVTSTSGKQERALTAYRRVIELDAAYPNVHYNIGLIHVDRREWDDAYDAFTRAIEANPNDQDAHHMRAQVDEVRSRPPDPANN